MTKVCSKCKKEKEINDFHKTKISKDGYKSLCKDCRKIESKKYYDKNRDSIIEKLHKYRKKHKTYIEINRIYRINNKDFVNNLRKEWSKSEKGKKSRQKYYQKNSDVIKERIRNYRKNNNEVIKVKDKQKREKSKYKEYAKIYRKKHKNLNPHVYAWRSLLTNTLKRLGTKKEGHTIDMLGYSAFELKEHLEKLFKENMSWDNYGKWHIDHIQPVSSFEKTEKASVVNSLSNLQPLWAEENLKKYNKLKK